MNCNDCPHLAWGLFVCDHPAVPEEFAKPDVITDIDESPEWCPLPEKGEADER